MTRTTFALGLGLLAAPLGAQDKRPVTWAVVLDGAVTSEPALEYATMPPGWHITTRVLGAIFYDAAWQAGPAGSVEAEVFLFPDSGPGEYGVLLGGEHLAASDRRYVAVLLNREGELGIFRRAGSRLDTVRAWTRHPAVAPVPRGATDAVKNVVRIDATPEGTRISVNGTAVVTVPGALRGQAGLRVGAHMNLHVSRFEAKD